MLTLRAGAASLVVAPEFGAGILGWMVGPAAILRRALPQAIAGDVHGMGCFPLLPYANRVGLGRFRWQGTEYRLKPNFGDHPHTIHGIGWQRPWTVAAAGVSAATLTLEHQPNPDWPFALHASVIYALEPDSLTVTLQMTNRHATPAPAGLGLHPYFPKAGDPTLRFNATGVWRNGPDSLPSRHVPPPPDWQHGEPRRVADSRLDNCFTGWNGRASIQAGTANVRIEASAIFANLQVFTPSWGDFFCAEPVTHAPDAMNRAEGMHVLPPGDTLSGAIRLLVRL